MRRVFSKATKYNFRMSFSFQVEATSGAARAGRFVTPHGVVETPVFMPVGTAASVKGVPQHILEELGVQILLNNTYHLYLRPGVETVRAMGGVQDFMSWQPQRTAQAVGRGRAVPFASRWLSAYVFAGECAGR